MKTVEEYDDMSCARIAGDGVHLSVIKMWSAFTTVHGIQCTYTSNDGKHFTSVRHCSAIVNTDAESLNETIILLKHDEFIKYVSVSATYLVHSVSIVTTLGNHYEAGHVKGTEIIQFKPPAGHGLLAFFGSVTNRGLSSIGTYVIKNEKSKLRLAFKKGIVAAHQRAQLRGVLRGKLNKGIEVEEAIGFIMTKYSELQVRSLCEATDQTFVKKVLDECNGLFGSISPQAVRRRKQSSLQLSFQASRTRRTSNPSLPTNSGISAFSLAQSTSSVPLAE